MKASDILHPDLKTEMVQEMTEEFVELIIREMPEIIKSLEFFKLSTSRAVEIQQKAVMLGEVLN